MTARSPLIRRAVLAGIALCLLGGIPLMALGSPAHGAIGATPTHPSVGPASPVAATTGCNNETGALSVSYSTVPANASGPAPLPLSWSFSYCTAANETLGISVTLPNGTVFSGNNGSTDLTLPAWYQINYTIRDCVAGAGCMDYYSYLWADAWGSGGPFPVSVNVTPAGGSIPLKVNASATVVGAPTGAIYAWATSLQPTWTSQPWSSTTFYQPGQYYVNLCVYYPGANNLTAMPFGCASSPTINVTGNSAYFLNVTMTPTSGVSPLNVSVQALVLNANQLPAGTYLTLQISATPGAVTWANATYTNNSPTTVSYSPGSGNYVSTLPDQNTSFFDTFYALYNVSSEVSVVAYLTDPQGDFLGVGGSLVALSPANNSPPPPFPEVSLTATPANGSSPLTVGIGIYLQGGIAPYSLSIGYWTNGTSGTVWNYTFVGNLTNLSAGGHTLSVTLTPPGFYEFEAVATDAVGLVSSGAYAYVNVGPASSPRTSASPLQVTGQANVGTILAGQAVQLQSEISGGTAPYSVQWAFGDGSYGSSQVGGTVSHVYASPGTYTPSVTVTDGAGHVQTYRLAPLVVTLPSPTATSRGSSNPLPFGYVALSLGSIGGAVLLGANFAIRRRRLRREGESLAADPPAPEDG